jgi:hypothetical protein
MGTLPTALTDLTPAAVNGLGQSAGPFVALVPQPPMGGTPPWAAYACVSSAVGTLSVTGSGDGTGITHPPTRLERASAD